MPKTKPLTKEQGRRRYIEDTCNFILGELNAEQGRGRKTDVAFGKELGISKSAWYRWRNGSFERAEFGAVLLALDKIGYRVLFQRK